MPLSEEEKRLRRSEYNRRYREQHRERLNQKTQAYYRDNREAILAREKARQQALGLTRKKAEPETILENARARRARWREANRDKIAEINRRYHNERGGYEKNKQARQRRRASDPEIQRRENVIYRLSQACGVPVSEIPNELVEAKLSQVRVRSATRARPKAKGSRT